MRVVIQIVKDAKLTIAEKVHSAINYGMLIFVSFNNRDNVEITRKMAEKVAKLRIFPDKNGKTNLDVNSVNGEVMSVSQFTLYGTFDSRRPSFTNVLKGEESIKLYDIFNIELAKQCRVQTGVFGAHMDITFTNVGPITYIVSENEE